MAKAKRAKQEPTKASGEPSGPTTADGRDAFSFKTTADFRSWMKRLAEHERLPAVIVMERALIQYAKSSGFTEEAPKRTRR